MFRLTRSRSTMAAVVACATLATLGVTAVQSAPADQAAATPTAVVRVGGAAVVTGLQPGATPTVRTVTAVSVSQTTTAPRAGGIPMELMPPLLVAACALLVGGVLVLRTRS